jgi:hypothetical protein
MSASSPEQIAQALHQAVRLRAEVARREKLIGRKVQRVARKLAELMGDGASFDRLNVEVAAFEVEGKMCLAAGYLDDVGTKYRYRYGVLYGGEPALRALRKARSALADEDEYLLPPRFYVAGYPEYEDFIHRLPKYVGDLVRRYEDALKAADQSDATVQHATRLLARIARASKVPAKPAASTK